MHPSPFKYSPPWRLFVVSVLITGCGSLSHQSTDSKAGPPGSTENPPCEIAQTPTVNRMTLGDHAPTENETPVWFDAFTTHGSPHEQKIALVTKSSHTNPDLTLTLRIFTLPVAEPGDGLAHSMTQTVELKAKEKDGKKISDYRFLGAFVEPQVVGQPVTGSTAMEGLSTVPPTRVDNTAVEVTERSHPQRTAEHGTRDSDREKHDIVTMVVVQNSQTQKYSSLLSIRVDIEDGSDPYQESITKSSVTGRYTDRAALEPTPRSCGTRSNESDEQPFDDLNGLAFRQMPTDTGVHQGFKLYGAKLVLLEKLKFHGRGGSSTVPTGISHARFFCDGAKMDDNGPAQLFMENDEGVFLYSVKEKEIAFRKHFEGARFVVWDSGFQRSHGFFVRTPEAWEFHSLFPHNGKTSDPEEVPWKEVFGVELPLHMDIEKNTLYQLAGGGSSVWASAICDGDKN